MKTIPFILLLILVTGCSSAATPDRSAPANTATPAGSPAPLHIRTVVPTYETTLPAMPVSETPSGTAAPQLIDPEFLPPISARPSIGSAKIEWKDDPLQPYLLLAGSLTNSCQDWAIFVNPPDEHAFIVVSVAVDKGISTGNCSENSIPIQREVLLGPFNPGNYSLFVNEDRVGDLTIQ